MLHNAGNFDNVNLSYSCRDQMLTSITKLSFYLFYCMFKNVALN
jgi:hypothetical protein